MINMTFLFISFLAGVLTVLAPCILPVLPIVIGRSVGADKKHRPLIVVSSLAVGIVLFTLLLKVSTAFVDIPQEVWAYISGGIILLFGIFYLFPESWEKIALALKLSRESNALLAKSAKKEGVAGDILVGLSLGPVFSSCSPTYFLILATVLPQSFGTGLAYLIAYALGLSSVLLLISLLGQRLTRKLQSAADPKGWFKRVLGLLFILVGIFILTGADKSVQTFILEKGFLDVTKLEQKLITDPMEEEMRSSEDSSMDYPSYQEIVNPTGFVNSEPFELADYVGEKVILLDFMTYSCINCQRTFPYLNAWYETYKDDGLIVVGIHTPEFAFEKKIENVEDAAEEFGLEFPLVLDNDYETWRAYGNRYWPRKYLIDIHGNIVYDHIGEGAYEETEEKIRELLEERSEVLGAENGLDDMVSATVDAEDVNFKEVRSPETYLGNRRNMDLGIIAEVNGNITSFTRPDNIENDRVYLVGDWIITDEYAEPVSDDAKIIYQYTAKNVFLVMGADKEREVRVSQDGAIVTNDAGEDVDANGTVRVQQETLYRLIESQDYETHLLELDVEPGIQAFAFTFG